MKWENSAGGGGTRRRRRAGTTRSRGEREKIDLEEMERGLERVQGHLVVWPSEWLGKEQETGNWLYNIDQLAPIEI